MNPNDNPPVVSSLQLAYLATIIEEASYPEVSSSYYQLFIAPKQVNVVKWSMPVFILEIIIFIMFLYMGMRESRRSHILL